MDITRESLEKTLKIHMDKMKFKLCLNSYENQDYIARLVDHLRSDVVIEKGDIVTVKIQTDRFLEGVADKKKMYEFNRLLEQCLRLIPRMFESLAHTPLADKLAYKTKTKKFRPFSNRQFEKRFPSHPLDKEINTTLDFRATVIHYKTGVIVREHGSNPDAATGAARAKMFSLLTDTELYKRDEKEWMYLESHDDMIFDIVMSAKVLNKEEVEMLIQKLKGEYLK